MHTRSPHPPANIRLVLVDDHTLLRESFKQILNAQPGIEVVGDAAGRQEGLALITKSAPTIIIQDICLGNDNGLEMLRHLKTTFPGIKCLVLTGFIEDDFILEAIQSHADGYLLKSCTMPALINAIRLLATGHKCWDASVLKRLTDLHARKRLPLQGESLDYLTAGEREISRLVAEGMTNSEIGRKVHLAEKTVRNRVSLIMDKLHVSRRAKLAAIYADTVARTKKTS
jgi:DNA-binding NarL/FixJ family response regulator